MSERCFQRTEINRLPAPVVGLRRAAALCHGFRPPDQRMPLRNRPHLKGLMTFHWFFAREVLLG